MTEMPHGTPERYRELGCRCPKCRRTHCNKGHEFTPENTGTSAHQVRRCRKCDAESTARIYRMTHGRAEQ